MTHPLPLKNRLLWRILGVLMTALVGIELILLVPSAIHDRRMVREQFLGNAALLANQVESEWAQESPQAIKRLADESKLPFTVVDPKGDTLWKTHSFEMEMLPPSARTALENLGGKMAAGEESGTCWAVFPLHAKGRVVGFFVAAKDPQALALSTWEYVLKTAWLILIICVAVSAAAYFFLTKEIMRPIYKLMRANLALSRGEEEGRLPVSAIPPHELGMVMRSREAMLDALEEARGKIAQQNEDLERWSGELEKRVESRTTQLEQARKRMVQNEKLAALGQLAASVAHEINNPLGIIETAAEELRRGETGKADSRPLTIIRDQIRRCSHIIQSLLGFSRQAPAAPEILDVPSLLTHCATLVRKRSEMDGKSVILKGIPDKCTVECTRLSLEQSVVNLLENALDVTPSGGKVYLEARMEGEKVRLCVRDEGRGIRPEVLAKIFDPFFTTKKVGQGTGVGLTLARNFILAEGGDLSCSSEWGEGTTFTITLPKERRV